MVNREDQASAEDRIVGRNPTRDTAAVRLIGSVITNEGGSNVRLGGNSNNLANRED